MIPNWLSNARPAQKRVDDRLPPASTETERKARLEAIAKENVRLQLEHLRQFPIVQKAEAEGRIHLNGVYYDIASGDLSVVE